MTIELAKEAEIRRLYFAEHWKVGTIVAQLGVHEDTVTRVIGLLSPRRALPPPRPLLCSPFAGFIEETLALYPRLRSTRLLDMLKPRGFKGSERTLREYVATVRPVPKTKAYLRVETLPGEQAQVVWAHVGYLEFDGHKRAVWAFVLVLSWSRGMFAELVLDLTADSLCRSLLRAGIALGGNPRQWLFDNPKVVVIERHGDAVRFHPTLLDFADKMTVAPRLCPVRTPQHKGKVERSIRYLRDRFFAGRTLLSLESGNVELRAFVAEIAHARKHPHQPLRTVDECLAEERRVLLPLPQHLPATGLVRPVCVDKTAFVRFDTNRYSVPYGHAGETLTLCADDREVRILDVGREVAAHRRWWGKHATREQVEHRRGLVRDRHASEAKGRDLLRETVPQIDKLCEAWVLAGRNVGSSTGRTVRLWELYGSVVLALAIDELLAHGGHDLGALAHLCEQRRRELQRPVPLDIRLPSHAKDRDVIPHRLEDYDDPF